jgi:hypothetical protein
VHRISLSAECINSALFMVLLWVDSLLTVLCKLRIACNLLSHAYLQIIAQVAMRAGNNGKRLIVSHRARAKEVYPFRLIKCKALDGCFSFKLNNYCVRLHCSMHNAHVIYVCAASVLVGMFAACFAQSTRSVDMVKLKLVQLSCLCANIIERNPRLDK